MEGLGCKVLGMGGTVGDPENRELKSGLGSSLPTHSRYNDVHGLTRTSVFNCGGVIVRARKPQVTRCGLVSAEQDMALPIVGNRCRVLVELTVQRGLSQVSANTALVPSAYNLQIINVLNTYLVRVPEGS